MPDVDCGHDSSNYIVLKDFLFEFHWMILIDHYFHCSWIFDGMSSKWILLMLQCPQPIPGMIFHPKSICSTTIEKKSSDIHRIQNISSWIMTIYDRWRVLHWKLRRFLLLLQIICECCPKMKISDLSLKMAINHNLLWCLGLSIFCDRKLSKIGYGHFSS